MDPAKDGKPVEQIIVIRRRSGGEGEDHHGGVWKIAFADFMTAMMAFFLVMWLVNATDQQTLTQVATYFSPIRLTDRVATPKGVNDVDESGRTKETSSKESDSKAKKKAKGGHKAPAPKSSEKEPPDKSKADATTGPDPQGKFAAPATGGAAATSEGSQAQSRTVDPFEDRDLTKPALVPSDRDRETALAATQAPTPGLEEKTAAETKSAALTKSATDTKPGAETKPAADADGGTDRGTSTKRSADLAREIQEAIANVGLTSKQGLDVQETKEGLLISLTDELDFGMFQISSAEPTPQLVSALEEIGRLLTQIPGAIHVRGHSDNRQFRSGRSDNWQLSSARAHAAFLALSRGGIASNRFERIEAYADRRPRNLEHREAAENRRIEILLLRTPPPAKQAKSVRP